MNEDQLERTSKYNPIIRLTLPCSQSTDLAPPSRVTCLCLSVNAHALDVRYFVEPVVATGRSRGRIFPTFSSQRGGKEGKREERSS